MKALLFQLLIFSPFLCYSGGQSNQCNLKLFNEDTTKLKGNFLVYYSIEVDSEKDSSLCIYLSNDTISYNMGCISYGLPLHNLGYVIADFDNYFVLKQGFGSGSLIIFYLYEKISGSVVLSNHLVDIDEENGFIIYKSFENDVNLNEFYLFDINKLKKYKISAPKNINKECEEDFLCFSLSSFHTNFVEISYLKKNNKKKYLKIHL